MVLEDLHELIETLQARIEAHGPALQQSEALTRYALIDPLLRGLGWDTGDPSKVIPEFKSGNGSADYALLGTDGKPVIIVEAKKLATPLGTAVSQVINYCVQDGYEHFAVTDGQNWEVYDIQRKGALPDKLVTRVDLAHSTARACLAALALWRPSAIAGSIRVGESPVTPSPSDPEPEQPRTPVVPPTGDGWNRLTDYTHKNGERPREVHLPSGEVKGARSWGLVTKAVLQYLIDEGKLTSHDLPIHSSSGKILVIEQSANPPQMVLTKVGSFYINLSFTAQPQVINCRTIISTAKLNPANFAVKLQ